ncbi:hypothetical protein [Amycolatopsis aidingensis]|uniref:hypothetical protein n=1 Tax=Amycolatopsis aidingensis TaxID=2842453 RepID=UPI001C0E7193|nr:hypothetical protein [Amycolatopsis aidingensis]
MPEHVTADRAWDALNHLLTGRIPDADDTEALAGAELIVRDGDLEVFRAALARHARRDHDDPAVFWIRPLVPADHDPDTGLPQFDPDTVPRRGLRIHRAQLDGVRLGLALDSGQHALIQPARGEQLAVLQDWDTWITTLPDDRRRDLESLDHD